MKTKIHLILSKPIGEANAVPKGKCIALVAFIREKKDLNQ
jgi:hypothetical protein